MSEWFPVRVGLRQGCVMSPWLFNLYIDGVIREVNAQVLGRGLKLVDGNDNEWELNQLLFADDTVVVADSERKLCQLVTEFGRVCERRKLRVNVGKSNSAADNQNNHAFCGTSMKFGILIAKGSPKRFGYGAIINFQFGSHFSKWPLATTVFL